MKSLRLKSYHLIVNLNLPAVGLSLKKRSSAVFGAGDPGITAAVKQLAWERDLNLSAGKPALHTEKPDRQLTPLDQIDSPPDSRPTTLSAPDTARTTVSIYIRLLDMKLRFFS